MTRHPNPRLHTGQKGATLIMALLVLVLIMMIGITAVTTSNTQFTLAGNLQFEDSAMNNAETAITTAEKWLATGTNFSDPGFTTYNSAASPQLHPIGHLPANSHLTMTWDASNSVQVAASQRYLIELLSSKNRLPDSGQGEGGRAATGCNEVNTYAITARGQSGRGASKFVQSNYSVQSC